MSLLANSRLLAGSVRFRWIQMPKYHDEAGRTNDVLILYGSLLAF